MSGNFPPPARSTSRSDVGRQADPPTEGQGCMVNIVIPSTARNLGSSYQCGGDPPADARAVR